MKSAESKFNDCLNLAEKGLAMTKEIGDSGLIGLMQKKVEMAKGGISMSKRLYATIDKAISEV